jgi:hypothetical protein
MFKNKTASLKSKFARKIKAQCEKPPKRPPAIAIQKNNEYGAAGR